MANILRSPPIPIRVGETINPLVDFTAMLRSGETIASIGGMTSENSYVTGSGFAANAAAETIDGQTVAIGKGVSFAAITANTPVAGQCLAILTVTTSTGQVLKPELDFRIYD